MCDWEPQTCIESLSVLAWKLPLDRTRHFSNRLPGLQRCCGSWTLHSAHTLAGNVAHLDSLHLGVCVALQLNGGECWVRV
jgi:hypothetical protein